MNYCDSLLCKQYFIQSSSFTEDYRVRQPPGTVPIHSPQVVMLVLLVVVVHLSWLVCALARSFGYGFPGQYLVLHSCSSLESLQHLQFTGCWYHKVINYHSPITIYVKIFTRRKFSPLLPLAKIYHTNNNLLSSVNGCLEDMVTFNTLVKNIFHQMFLQYS